MISRKKYLITLIFSFIVLLINVSDGNGNDIQLTDKDKAQIIKSIFLTKKLEGRIIGIIYLSSENISPGLVPRISGIRIVLVSPEEIKERSKINFWYFAFGEFKVKGSKVLVSLGNNSRHVRSGATYQTTYYEYQKVKGRWKGKEIYGTIGLS
jgi:hypothetical protein